jgi:EmrB/QacA subfamily drug resistance transporter
VTTLSPGTEQGGDVGRPTAATAENPRRWFALWVIAAAQMMVVLDASIVTIALPHAQSALHISTANRQWVVTAYTLTFGGLLLLGGRIADYVGRKRVFVWGLIGFAGASALGGAAPNAAMLFGARALQGAFGALLAPAALSLITVTFTEARERARAFGVYGAISGGGAALGLIIGGVLTEYASWRWCLFINAPIAVVTALLAIPVVQESKSEGEAHYDIPGAVTVTAGLLALVYGFTKAAQDGWSAGTTVLLLAISVVLLAAFVVIEARTADPLLPLRVPLDRSRGASFLSSLLVGAGLFAMFLFLTYYFQASLHYSALRTGFAFLPFSLGVIVSAGLASQLLPRIGPKPLMMGGTLLATGGMLLLTLANLHTSYVSHVLPPEMMISIGMGFVFVPMASTSLTGVAPADAGVASALVNTTQQVGGSLGTALLNTVFATAVTSYASSHIGATDAAAKAQLHGYQTAYIWGAAMILIAFVVIAALLRGGKENLPDPAVPAVG